MSIAIGTKLGAHEITGVLGRGGMGEVYRARDTKLKRDVAIKILPEEFSLDPERIARFHREARAIAALNHANIAAIHELGETRTTKFLVLELVEGDTLAQRIQRGPLPLEEALNIARQIGEALEAAHEKGIIHRDLKPANIKITPQGKVKLLDFGLARIFEDESEDLDSSNSPTLVSATAGGVILGTAAYMSPEQARGQKADKQSDVWAFGCVLYEMLTGQQIFRGQTVTDILSGIIRSEPDWSALPQSTPVFVRSLLRRCLRKERSRRLRDIADARIEIEEAGTPAEREPDRAKPQEKARRVSVTWFAAVLAIALVLGAALVVVSLFYFNRTAPPEIRVEVNTPSTSDPLSFAISPDGRRLVFSASSEGKSQLWVRPLDSVAAQPLAGTDGASYPFWSPDTASVGFFADDKLKRIDIVGGAPQVLANAVAPWGGSWNRDGTILFAPAGAGPLLKVPATGGEPVAVTQLEAGQAAHKFPQFLPDGRHFIYFIQGAGQGVYAGSLDGGPSKKLVNADAAAVVFPSGFLLMARQTTLFAQAFDFKRQELSGNPFPVAEHAALNTTGNAAGLSATLGIVAYRTSPLGLARQLTWLDRSGKTVGTIGGPDTADLTDVELSPDGKHVAVYRTVNSNPDIWLIDTARGVPTRLTFDNVDQRPVWSPDGATIYYLSDHQKLDTTCGFSDMGIWKMTAAGGDPKLLLAPAIGDENSGLPGAGGLLAVQIQTRNLIEKSCPCN